MSELTTLGPFKFIQPKKGYRHGIDSVLLANFVEVSANHNTLLDAGSGDGIISIILKHKFPQLKITGIEIQEKLYRLSIENAKLNNLEIDFIHTNLFYIKNRFKQETFDIIVCNPPYYPRKNGRLCESQEKNLARHEIFFNIDNFLKLCKYLLKHKGILFLIYPHNRFIEILEKIKNANLHLKKIRFIHNTIDEPSNLILFEILKMNFKIPVIDKPLIIYKNKDRKIYTDEVKKYLFLEVKNDWLQKCKWAYNYFLGKR